MVEFYTCESSTVDTHGLLTRRQLFVTIVSKKARFDLEGSVAQALPNWPKNDNCAHFVIVRNISSIFLFGEKRLTWNMQYLSRHNQQSLFY